MPDTATGSAEVEATQPDGLGGGSDEATDTPFAVGLTTENGIDPIIVGDAPSIETDIETAADTTGETTNQPIDDIVETMTEAGEESPIEETPTTTPSASNHISSISFALDGSGEPMELWFDIPHDEFEGLLVNGEEWVEGIDFTARPGSTIVSITAERLMQLEAGRHIMTLVFSGEVLDVVFTLLKPLPPITAGGSIEEYSEPIISEEIIGDMSLAVVPNVPARFNPLLVVAIGAPLMLSAVAIFIKIKKKDNKQFS